MAAFTFADNVYGTIASGITSSELSITLTTGHGVRFPVVSGTILPATLVNSSNVVEQIHITAHSASSDTLTVTRAANGTTGKAWSAGDRIEVRLTSEFLNIAALLFGSTDAVAAFSLLPSVTTLTVGAGASVASTVGHASAATLFPGGISIPTGKTLSGAGSINITGGITINTDKFTVAAATGNTLIAGTLGVTGITKLSRTTDLAGVGHRLVVEGKSDTTAIALGLSDLRTGSTGSTMVTIVRNEATVGSITTTDAATAYNTSSDARLKNDLGLATDVSVLSNTQIHNFSWKGSGSLDRGVFAQDAVKVNPRAIAHDKDSDWWGADYSKYVPDLIVGWQNHEARLAALENK